MEEDKRKNKKNNKKKKKKNNNKKDNETAGETSTSSFGGDNDNDNDNENDDKAIHHHTANNINACASAYTHDKMQHWLQEEARLREMVKNLLYEKDSFIQCQSALESQIKQLQTENDSWKHNEVMMEQRISQLLQENSTLSFQEKNLQEKCQHVEKEKLFLVENENLSKEVISNLNNENTRLKMQVLELEGARDSLSQENKLLLDNISTLQSRVQNLEMSLASALSQADAQKDLSEKNLNVEMEEAYALIGKLMTENADLVEKVNMLSMELGQQTEVADATSVDILDYSTSGPVSRYARYAEDSQQDVPLSKKSANLSGTVSTRDEQVATDEMDSDYASVIRHSSNTTLTGEIVQISLDESESQDLEVHSSVIAGDESVPLADAPLIGAPFRFISFVANYVSGADLVEKDSSNSLP